MSSCFFLGHREAPASIRDALDDAIERHITEYGVTDFVVGHYGNFDNMAQAALVRAKERHPTISCRVLIPYHPAERPEEVPEGFDGTFYPPGMARLVLLDYQIPAGSERSRVKRHGSAEVINFRAKVQYTPLAATNSS